MQLLILSIILYLLEYTNKELHFTYLDSLEVWAPVHAWRALGQLRATEAIEPLITLFHDVEDEWNNFDLPLAQ